MAGIASILRLADNVDTIINSIGMWCNKVVTDNKVKILDLNRNVQMYEEGTNSLGVSIMDYRPYHPLTIQIKSEKGQPTDRVTLRDTGDFQQSFTLTADNQGFTIDADDWKRDELVEKYGEDIFGLTEENKIKVASEILLPELINKVKETLWH